ncbi:flavodoxin family protein BilS [Butyrivibrio sp. AE3009]|uniref:flavodoxin family protein BilS n=1 Tax=Butyrivibrio sp. AE3009 TaxID=1280666 RepID=UPI0003B56DA6|nr:flavodoxin family protein BilS [Butyrivibrio sp. AE3009]
MLKYLVIYASQTGNTQMLAEEIYNSLPVSSKEKKLVDVRSWHGETDAETYIVGFWANRGSCSLEIIDLLSSLYCRNVALFGTCGMGAGSRYYESLEQNARVWLPDSNRFLGSFFCQGKMPIEIRQKYESYKGKCDDARIDQFLGYFDEAASHPDRQDFMHAHMFVEKVVEKAKENSLEYA